MERLVLVGNLQNTSVPVETNSIFETSKVDKALGRTTYKYKQVFQ